MINNAKVAGIVRAMLVVNALLNAERAPFSSLLAILRDNSEAILYQLQFPRRPEVTGIIDLHHTANLWRLFLGSKRTGQLAN